MMRAGIFLIFMILMGQTAGAQAVITKEQSRSTIDIMENGNAMFLEEKFYPLTSRSAISEWNWGLKDTGNFSKKKATDINERINRSLLSAMNNSGRPMKVRNFNITYDLVEAIPNAYGVIRISYEWVNFSRINDSDIIIGDAFPEGMAPSPDNVLVMNIPAGYDVVNASPGFDRRDGNRLIWDGTMYRSFSKGEPSLVISNKIMSQDSFVMEIVILVILVGAGVFIFWKREFCEAYFKTIVIRIEDIVQAQLKHDVSVGNNEPGIENQELQPASQAAERSEPGTIAPVHGVETIPETRMPHTLTSLPAYNEEILGDEEMIERYLLKFGGQAYQTDIVKESELSKSKISIVLAKMKDEGRIIKIRKGKENIIRLVKK
ncbi:MAG: hypothetical protein KKD46_08260 [Euryarchaeota archaeon]|nr:hypothetical protein [Euryarchaeota archaeon]MBU4220780.1 hypothetical protein [Euryarchaeota archaeon]MBU4340888.1 hypothetical protein [Euryarchaeota archaeon]MCG2736165.1 hypothetical protein [Candidatus Methanoperedenaceae archaeon]